MDCIDMQSFVKGLSLAYNVLPSSEKEMVNFNDISAQVTSLCNDNVQYPRYLVNIADHTSKFGDSWAVESKRVHTMAWLLLNFVSHFRTPKILHTDNGREFISLAYDRKYDGVKFVNFNNDKVQQIIKKFQDFLPGTKMVHGKARHSESQGFIENRNKKALMENNTACYWLGALAMRYAINTRINHSTKMSLYEYLYGVKPTGGLNNLPVDGKLLASLSKEEELNRLLEIPIEQQMEFYNQSKKKIENIPAYDDVDDKGFHLFHTEWSNELCVDEDTVLEMIAAEQLLNFDDDGDGKLPALLPINPSMTVGEEEEGSDDFADALME
jgi:hypothetical protein